MAEHILTRQLTLDLPREKVFEFFANAANLELFTPPQLKFHIVSPQPLKLEKGTLIDYKLSLRGFSLTWRTIISVWNPPFEFIDEALKSPYKQWIHKHTFTEIEKNKTLIEDEVRYRLPFEPLSDLAHWFVRRELMSIFDFREKAVAEILQAKTNST